MIKITITRLKFSDTVFIMTAQLLAQLLAQAAAWPVSKLIYCIKATAQACLAIARTKEHEFKIGVGPLLRYQASSYPDITVFTIQRRQESRR